MISMPIVVQATLDSITGIIIIGYETTNDIGHFRILQIANLLKEGRSKQKEKYECIT
jgi:hypothetical protein